MKEIKIFLAHTSEVDGDIDKIRLAITSKYQKNKNYKIIIEHWSSSDKSIKKDNSYQDELNKILETCEILYVFFEKRIGENTKKEWKHGLKKFEEGKNPKCISVFFRKYDIDSDAPDEEYKDHEKVRDLKKEIKEKHKNQYIYSYNGIDNLKNQLIEQLDIDIKKLIPELIEESDSDEKIIPNNKKVLIKTDKLIKEHQCCSSNRRIKLDFLLEELVDYFSQDISNFVDELILNDFIQIDIVEIFEEDKYKDIEHISIAPNGRKQLIYSRKSTVVSHTC